MHRLQIVYLTGEHTYLRPLVAADRDVAVAWHPGPFFISASRAETVLKEGNCGEERRLALVRREDDEVVGSVTLTMRDGGRRCMIFFHVAPAVPDADALQADALHLLVSWLRDGLESMVIAVETAADEVRTIAAAEELGMELGVRLREFVARPGRRVDRLVYQVLSQAWEVRNA